jgi:D-alanyl-D-alanine endopeptidase (penicillin-binding protein 7)
MDAVLNWLWQGGVVVAALSVMLFALKRAPANVRYVVCWAAAFLVIALPILAQFQPAAPVNAIGVSDGDAIVALPDTWWTSTRVILGAAILWIGVNLLRLLSAIAAIRAARRGCREFPAHLESLLPHGRRIRRDGRRAALVLSDSVTSAAVLGWGAPIIAVAPALVTALDPADLDRVVIHEWAHVQRRDDIVNALHVLARLVGGWHPALWWIERRLHVEREIACDERTVAITGLPKSYAECLVKLSALKGTHRTIMAPAMYARTGLRARVLKIVSTRRPIAPVWSGTLATSAVLGLCLLSMAVGGITLVEARAFAEPVLSAATHAVAIPVDRQAPVPVPSTAPATNAQPSRRAAPRATSPRRPATDAPALPQPDVQPATPPQSREPSTPPMDAVPQPTALIAPEGTAVALTPPGGPNATESPRSPWSAAAAGGATVGRKSKDAGVATAGFFTRIAKRVAGSF